MGNLKDIQHKYKDRNTKNKSPDTYIMLREQQHAKGEEHRQIHFCGHQLRIQEIAFDKMQHRNNRQHISNCYQTADVVTNY